jgi:hypothetical protein
MLAYARLTPGPGFAPDRALFYYAQRLVTLPAARRAISSVIARCVRRRQGRLDNDGLSRDTPVLAQLDQDGLVVLEPLLAPDEIDAMVAYFLRQDLVGSHGEATALAQLPEGTSEAAYPLDVVLACPGMLDVLNTPQVLQIASAYLGCKPTLSSVGVRWSFPRGRYRTKTQEYHRDLDDWRFLKLFIYLTDVDEECGPHSYVRGSHKTGFGLRAHRYDRGDIEGRYGTQALITVLGAGGTSFIADTLGIHCGLTPTERPRLVLQMQYSLLPIYTFLYQPAERLEADFDAYCNRLLFRPPSRRARGGVRDPSALCERSGRD